MTVFNRPSGLREWLYGMDARISRIEAGGVRPVLDEDEANRPIPETSRTQAVPRDNLDEYLRRLPWPR